MAHRNGTQFDREDLRLLESLRTFAQAAVWKDQVETERRERSAQAAAAEMANALAHQINNPLQALTNSMHMLSCDDNPEVLRGAQAQVGRISELVRRILALGSGVGI